MAKYTVYYSVQNCGDGSAYPIFYDEEICADIHQELEPEGWGRKLYWLTRSRI